MPMTSDPYVDAKALGLYREIGNHEFKHVNAEEIVRRIMKSRAMYEDRQRKKEEKATTEEAFKRSEASQSEVSDLQKEETSYR